jgi:hypothetical protein
MTWQGWPQIVCRKVDAVTNSRRLCNMVEAVVVRSVRVLLTL